MLWTRDARVSSSERLSRTRSRQRAHKEPLGGVASQRALKELQRFVLRLQERQNYVSILIHSRVLDLTYYCCSVESSITDHRMSSLASILSPIQTNIVFSVACVYATLGSAGCLLNILLFNRKQFRGISCCTCKYYWQTSRIVADVFRSARSSSSRRGDDGQSAALCDPNYLRLLFQPSFNL